MLAKDLGSGGGRPVFLRTGAGPELGVMEEHGCVVAPPHEFWLTFCEQATR